MSDPSLTVKISADVVELQAKLAIARAELSSFNAELRAAAKDQTTSGLGAAMSADLLKASEGAIQARSKVDALSGSLEKAGVNVRGIREINAAVHDLLSGNVGALPGAFAILGHSFAELGIAGIGAVAGVTALGAGLVELALHEKEAAEAAEQARGAFAFQGIAENAAQVNAWVEQVADMPGVSQKAASAYVQAFGGIRYATDQLKSELLDLVPVLQQEFGEQGPKKAAELAAAFNDLKGKGEETLRALGAAPDTMSRFYAALNQGDQSAAFKILLQQIAGNLKIADVKFDQSALEAKSFWENVNLGLLGGANDAELLGQAIQEIDDAKLKKIADDMAAATQTPATQTKMPGSDADFQAQLEKIRDDTQRSNIAILNDEIAAYAKREQELASFGQNTEVIDNQRLSLIAERGRAAGSEAVSAARTQISAIAAQSNVGNVQKLEQERAVWQQLKDGEVLTYQQRLDAQRSFNNSTAALQKAQQAESQAIEKSNADTDLAISKLNLEAKKSILSQEEAAHVITAHQEFAMLADIARQEEALDEERLQKELALLQDEPAKYAEVYNQIRLLRAKLSADLGAYAKQETLDTQKEAKDQNAAWQGMVNQIESAESSLVSNVLSGREKVSTSVLQSIGRMIESEIAADLKYLTNHLFVNAGILASDQKTDAGGFLSHLLFENQKTTTTAAGTATRKVLNASEGTSLISEIGQTLAQWLGFETTKTTTTTAQAALRTASDVTEGATAASTEAAAAAEAVAAAHLAGFAYAGEAAAAAMASVAAIPFIGWAMAPGVGAETFALAAGFASAEGGMWDVPQTMLSVIHPQESIVPAAVAGPMRDFFSSGGSQSGGAQPIVLNQTLNVSAMDGPSVSAFASKYAQTFAKATMTQLSRNPSLRPGY